MKVKHGSSYEDFDYHIIAMAEQTRNVKVKSVANNTVNHKYRPDEV